MRVIFFGTSSFAVPSLEQLVAAHHEVAVCVTRPDRPQGRGLSETPSPVKEAAVKLGLPVAQPERPQAELFRALQPEIGIVIAYGQLIRRDLLELPPHGMLGVHPSLLPRYRGAAPINWALLNGETETGLTIFRLNEQLDAGEIISQRRVAIAPDECAETLTQRLAIVGAQELARALETIALSRVTYTPQDDAQATFAPKLTKEQGRIDWRQPAVVIERLVRATIPWPGATTRWQDAPLKVWRVKVDALGASRASAAPGTVVHVTPDAVSVAAGTGAVVLQEVQPPGRRRMPIKEFLAGHPVQVGETLG